MARIMDSAAAAAATTDNGRRHRRRGEGGNHGRRRPPARPEFRDLFGTKPHDNFSSSHTRARAVFLFARHLGARAAGRR